MDNIHNMDNESCVFYYRLSDGSEIKLERTGDLSFEDTFDLFISFLRSIGFQQGSIDLFIREYASDMNSPDVHCDVESGPNEEISEKISHDF